MVNSEAIAACVMVIAACAAFGMVDFVSSSADGTAVIRSGCLQWRNERKKVK